MIKKATKVKKAPSNRPKKPLSSFFLYVTETREAVQAANPDLKLVQVTTLIGQKWAALPIDQKQVRFYVYFISICILFYSYQY